MIVAERNASRSRLLLQFYLLQPELHPHLAVHRRGGCQMLPCLRPVPGTLVQLAEPEVAVGGEGSHAEFGGQSPCVTVVANRPFNRRRIAVRGDLAQEAKRPALEPAVLERAEELEDVSGKMARALGTTGTEVGFHQDQPWRAEEPIGGDLRPNVIE